MRGRVRGRVRVRGRGRVKGRVRDRVRLRVRSTSSAWLSAEKRPSLTSARAWQNSRCCSFLVRAWTVSK